MPTECLCLLLRTVWIIWLCLGYDISTIHILLRYDIAAYNCLLWVNIYLKLMNYDISQIYPGG